MSTLPTEISSSPARRAPRAFALLLFGLVAVSSVAFGFLTHSVNESRILVQRFGYYTIAATFFWAVIAGGRMAGAWWKSFPKNHARQWVEVGLVIVSLTAIAVLTVPYTYKVLYDEFVLQATASSMHETREVGAIVRGYEIEGVFTTLLTYLDKRPFFFTFLVSLLHDLTGAREGNAFWFNSVLMPVTLGLTYLFVRKVADHRSSLVTLAGLGAFSLLAQNATGSGMEMLNLAMLLMVMHLAAFFLEKPNDVNLSALILAAVLLAQTRYESSLYIAPVALVIVEGWRRANRVLLPAAAILAPALLIPYALHNTYLSGTPMLWELRDGMESRFGLTYLNDNLLHAWKFLFSFSGSVTNSSWLSIAGIPALAWGICCAVRGAKRWKQTDASILTIVLVGGTIIVNLGLLMFYYWGQLDDPIVSRLSLPFCMLLAVMSGWVIANLRRDWRKIAVTLSFFGIALSYVKSGLLANATHWELNQQAREIAWEYNTVKAMSPESRLIVTNKSALMWLSDKIAAVPITQARNRIAGVKFHLDQHTFKEVLVMQTYRPTTIEGEFQLDPLDRLPDNFILEPLYEKRFGTRLARISRISEIQFEQKAAEPAAHQKS